jgi:Zn-dependent protease/CBS domain-containing protein
MLGFEVTVDYSWFIIFGLVLWSFSMNLLPAAAPGYSSPSYLLAGLVSALALFASLLAHELSHSVVARAKGIEVEGITLFIFGGVARTRTEALTPGDEFQIAGVGPLASFVIALLFGALAVGGARAGLPELIVVPAQYLGYLNLVLAIFNLLPGFPLDGGRLFRAIVWKLTGNLTRATRIATMGGEGLGWALIGWGLYRAFVGAMIGGLWMVFIGWFLRNAAANSYRQHIVQSLLTGVTARQAMSDAPVTVRPDITLYDATEQVFDRHRFGAFPVTDGERPVGVVTRAQVDAVPEGDRTWRPVADAMAPLDARTVVTPDDPLLTVLEKLHASPARRLLVIEDGRLVGIIAPSDVAAWMQRARSAALRPDPK